MRSTASTLILFAAFAAGCAGNPQPGESGYPYNLTGRYQAEFLVEGNPYRGTMDLSTAPGGAVSGSFAVTDPGQVVGSVEGTIVADSLDFAIPYEILENGCAGIVRGRGAIVQGGAGLAGPIQLDDACDGQMSGTLTLTR